MSLVDALQDKYAKQFKQLDQLISSEIANNESLLPDTVYEDEQKPDAKIRIYSEHPTRRTLRRPEILQTEVEHR